MASKFLLRLEMTKEIEETLVRNFCETRKVPKPRDINAAGYWRTSQSTFSFSLLFETFLCRSFSTEKLVNKTEQQRLVLTFLSVGCFKEVALLLLIFFLT